MEIADRRTVTIRAPDLRKVRTKLSEQHVTPAKPNALALIVRVARREKSSCALLHRFKADSKICVSSSLVDQRRHTAESNLP